MGRYTLRNGKVQGQIVGDGTLEVKVKDEPLGVAYIKLETNQVGSAGLADRYAYIFMGTAGRLCIATGAPTGTTGNFANKGNPLGTAS